MAETQKEGEDLRAAYITWWLQQRDNECYAIQRTEIEIARNLLAMKVLTHEQIAQAVDLPLEFVGHLAQEITS